MKEVLNYLFEHKTLNRTDAKNILMGIGKGDYNSSSVAAFMSVYLMRSIAVDELAGFRDALLELCLPVEFSKTTTIDIVGTGGDGKNTFNISTLSCLIVAACGVNVTKHGNYGVSSVSGSSNVLEKCGIQFTNDSVVLNRQLDEAGVCFMHAPLFHPAMKNVAPIRKELSVRTFFNLLGPLVNPSNPSHMLLGTYNLEILRLYNYLLQETALNYTIVHSFDGYDEVSLTSDFKMVTNSGEFTFTPQALGLKKVFKEDINGGNSPDDAAKIFLDILKGKGTEAQNNAVAANAGIAIHSVKNEMDLCDCVAVAKEKIVSGKGIEILNKLIKL